MRDLPVRESRMYSVMAADLRHRSKLREIFCFCRLYYPRNAILYGKLCFSVYLGDRVSTSLASKQVYRDGSERKQIRRVTSVEHQHV